MPALVSLLLIFLAPPLIAMFVGAILPQQASLGGMLIAFFLASIVCVFVASEIHAGKVRSFADLVEVVGFGLKAFGWWAAALGCGFAVLGFMLLVL